MPRRAVYGHGLFDLDAALAERLAHACRHAGDLPDTSGGGVEANAEALGEAVAQDCLPAYLDLCADIGRN